MKILTNTCLHTPMYLAVSNSLINMCPHTSLSLSLCVCVCGRVCVCVWSYTRVLILVYMSAGGNDDAVASSYSNICVVRLR
jgi:hypothetical protein